MRRFEKTTEVSVLFAGGTASRNWSSGHSETLNFNATRPASARPSASADSAAPKSLDPKQNGLGLGFRVPGLWFMVWGFG